jgi:molybdate-binding protein
MNSSTIEITENEYCIKLSKDTFDLTLVRQLIKRIQAEELFFSRKRMDEDEDLLSRNDATFEENFDRLCDK